MTRPHEEAQESRRCFVSFQTCGDRSWRMWAGGLDAGAKELGDLVTLAALAGHARLETLKVYSNPTGEDEQSVLRRLTVDR
jgi:hypothetical protein